MRPGTFAVVTAALGMLVAPVAVGQEAPKNGQSRGELLYSTHCVACHTTQVHWRDKKIATDWTRLVAQVRRWQQNSGLNWTDDDIGDVARYLNGRYYHYTMESKQVSRGREATPATPAEKSQRRRDDEKLDG